MTIQPSDSFEATTLAIAWDLWKETHGSNIPTTAALAEEVSSVATTLRDAFEG